VPTHRTATGRRYCLRQHLVTVPHDYWIQDDHRRRTYRVRDRPTMVRDAWTLEGRHGERVATVRQRRLRLRPAYRVEVGTERATVRRALSGLYDRFHVDLAHGEDLEVRGDIFDHEYVVTRHGTRVARVSKRWFRVRDTFGVEVYGPTDPVLVLSITVAVVALLDA
jgi:uncharacterized protein YxjI